MSRAIVRWLTSKSSDKLLAFGLAFDRSAWSMAMTGRSGSLVA
jgi:hypothetical protein